MEVDMDDHRPHTSDWEAGNPRIRPGLWFAGFFGMIIVAILGIGLVGRLLNGDGSPFLS
jgi:hypothetical protein